MPDDQRPRDRHDQPDSLSEAEELRSQLQEALPRTNRPVAASKQQRKQRVSCGPPCDRSASRATWADDASPDPEPTDPNGGVPMTAPSRAHADPPRTLT